MDNRGYILETSDDKTAKFKMQKHSACASCGKCAHSHDKKEIIVDVYNDIGAQKGDYVEVNLESVNVLKAAFIAYFIPLAALLFGTITTYFILTFTHVKAMELISGACGFALMVLAFLWIRLNDNKFKHSKKYLPVVQKVIQREATVLDIN